MATILQRFRSGWNAFLGRDPTKDLTASRIGAMSQFGYAYSQRPDRFHYRTTNARAVVAKIYNRIALDVAMINIIHAKVDKDGNYVDTIKDGLNDCLTLDTNLDQTGMAFFIDLVQSMFDEGCVAVVPVDTTSNPLNSDSYDVRSLRVGRITGWYPYAVRVEVYNENTGKKEELLMPKRVVGIIENPFYSVMNEGNSTLQSLLRTIRKLDAWNDQNASGKLDLIIQLPQVIKSEQRQREAKARLQDLENQLTGSPLGIGYIDGTEKVVQLNRSVENNLWTQVKELTTQLYNELGLTQAIIDGTADEQTSINYFEHTISPICKAICDELSRKFLSKKARSTGQAVVYFRDPFKLVPVAQLADIADRFRRNEIMTSNEFRSKIGLRPSDAEEANSLRNPNLNKSNAEEQADQDNPGDEHESGSLVDQLISETGG